MNSSCFIYTSLTRMKLKYKYQIFSRCMNELMNYKQPLTGPLHNAWISPNEDLTDEYFTLSERCSESWLALRGVHHVAEKNWARPVRASRVCQVTSKFLQVLGEVQHWRNALITSLTVRERSIFLIFWRLTTKSVRIEVFYFIKWGNVGF